MKLVNENEFKKLLSSLKIEDTIAGGSVANSIVGLAQLGNKVVLLERLVMMNSDPNMKMDLKKEKVEYFYIKKKK